MKMRFRWVNEMINLKYSFIIEAKKDTSVGHSVEDSLYKARWGMEEHIQLLREKGLPIPQQNPNPTVIIQNENRLETVVEGSAV